MTSHRAPKQWSLSSNETITSIEAWENNLKYILSLDPNFADFLTDGSSWGKKTNATPLRGFSNDPESVPTARRRTAAQKVTHLEMMLGQIANYAPIISRNSIVKNSTSISGVWQSIRQHYGLQLTGSRFLDLANISLKPEQRPEDLFQILMAFIEDNLLTRSSGITHYGEIPDADEELSPSLENFIVLTWLRLLHPNLPRLVKQRYGTELRSRTLASVKPEISQALESLLDELHTSDESKVLRSAPRVIIAHLFPHDAGYCLNLELSSLVLFASRPAAQIFGHIFSAVASFCPSLIVSSCPRFAKWPALN